MENKAQGTQHSLGIKALFIITTDAHNYKITGMLKQLKFDNCSDMFRFTQEPSSGTYFVLS